MTKRKKQKEFSEGELSPVLAFAWYTPEQYERLLEVASDRDSLQNTYEEWKGSAENLLQELSRPGVIVRKVMIDVEELLRWCTLHKLPVNGDARTKFVAEKVPK